MSYKYKFGCVIAWFLTVSLSLYISIFSYFEDEEEESNNVDLPYIPAENSPTRQQFQSKPADSDSEDDPLEAFMAEVEVGYHFCVAKIA